ncbi:MAG TPA: S9 family peptidase [Candidatus Limnocylindrales bacterium]|nr:S9 family peptidase [Candidatus Limnocylindrales bacterium]
MRHPSLSFISRFIIIAICFSTALAVAQPQPQKPLTVEWMFSQDARGVAQVPRFEWLQDGTAIVEDTRVPEAQRTLERFNPATGERKPALDREKALASLKKEGFGVDLKAVPRWPVTFDSTGNRAVYELSRDLFLLDLPSATFTRMTVTAEEEKDPQFSPDGKKIAFVRSNDLYVYDIASRQETRLTRDGSGTTLNGTLSWVYWEEIFGRRDIGYWWSPDSRSIAYLQTDESGVPISTFVDFQPVDEHIIRQVYPKAGEKNPHVRVGVMDIAEPGKTRWMDISDKPYEWLLRVKWLPDSTRLAIETMPRIQTELRLYFVNGRTGDFKPILTETDPAWVNISDDLYFLKDGDHFLWASERDGYMHLYRYKMDGTLVNQITKGDWAMASSGGGAFWVRRAVVGIDETNGLVYFTALKDSSIDRNLYRIKMDGSHLTRLSSEHGTHRIAMSPDTRFYFDTYSNIKTLPSLRLHTADGREKQTLAAPRPELLPAGMRYPELTTIPAEDGFAMPAQILKPKGFKDKTKYPVIVHVYGGPSAPTVSNAWQNGLFYDELLSNEGYVVVAFDNRAATAISKKLEDTIEPHPGETETADLVAGIRWLKKQRWVDGERVGIWGWSGGGTMTLNVMTASKEIKAGIAGAPVTDWHFYDSKWAEALMKLPQQNAAEYDRSSLVKRAGNLTGRLMMIFGTYDDNVHPQNEQALMNELIKAQKPFEVTLYPMRKHGFTDASAREHLDRAMIDFWKRNL